MYAAIRPKQWIEMEAFTAKLGFLSWSTALQGHKVVILICKSAVQGKFLIQNGLWGPLIQQKLKGKENRLLYF